MGPLVATFWPSCCPSFFHRFFDAILDASWLDFPSQLASQNPQNPSKIDAEMHIILHVILPRLLIDFCSQLRLPESQKSSPGCSESTIFQKIAFRNWHRFLIDYGGNLPPFCLPKSTTILPKIDSKMHQFFDRFLDGFWDGFLMDFGSQLGAMLAAFSAHKGGPCEKLACFLLRFF